MILSNTLVLNNKKRYVKKYTDLIDFLKISKNFFLKKKKIKQNLVSYVIHINLTSTNTIVTITSVEGEVITSMSSGMIGLTKFQKRSHPVALMSIFKSILLKSKFLKNSVVALHFRNVKRFNELFFIKALKNLFLIKSFQSSNLTPHNGCRPKKIKKIKRRTKRLTIK